MIEWMGIKNFQSHKKLKVVFGQVTTVTGDSDVGKSAIVRALRWVATNQPNGDSFIRRGATECSVTVVVDGHTIIRRRSKKRNEYVLDGQVFRAMGNTVPEPIAAILNVAPINFQLQHEPAYWFHLPSSHVSKELNRIVQLEVIDKAQSAARRAVAAAKAKRDAVREMVAEDTLWLQGRSWVPTMAGEWDRVERLKGEWAEKAQIASQCAATLESASNHGAARKRAVLMRSDAVTVLKCAQNAAELDAQGAQAARVAHSVGYRGAQLHVATLECEAMRLGLQRARAGKVFNEWQQAQKQAIECTQAAKDVEAELAAMGVCPTCGQKVRS